MKKQDELIISGVHLDLTDALKQIVREKTDKLFRHEEDILRIRMELEFDGNKSNTGQFIAKGHIEIDGPDLIASASTNDLYKSIDKAVLKLDRQLRKRARLQLVKRKDTHKIDIPASLPKVNTA